jgi:hypothetical protein
MAKGPAKGLFEGVRLYWYKDGPREALDGTVRIGKGEIVLDIPSGDGPYLIEGKQTEHWFEGINTLSEGGRVQARWAWVGDGFVGRWIEGANEYLFWFTLRKGG